MYFNIETITPERAKELLLNSRRNRRLNTGRVTTYANDIRNGKWTQSPEPICLDEEGKLTNGQHRLNAVILAGIPIQCAVAYNVPIDAVVDKGLERASGDALYMRGLVSKEMSSAKVIAIVNRYLTMLGRERVSDTDRAEFIISNQDNIAKTLRIAGVNARNSLCSRAPVASAILGALNSGVPDDVLVRFATVVNTGFMSNANESAAIVLRNCILNMALHGGTQSGNLCLISQMSIRDFSDGTPRKRNYSKLQPVYIKQAA